MFQPPDPVFLLAVTALLVIVVPALGIVEWGRLRHWTAAGHPGARRRLYLWIMGLEWALAGGLLAWWLAQGRGFAAVRLVPDAAGWQWLVVVLGLGASGLLVARMNAGIGSPETLAEVRTKLGDLVLLAPRDSGEIRLFDALSVTAGVCEELLYRGILLALTTELMGLWPAVIATSAVFGLGHAYQGAGGIGKTTVVGAVFALLAVFSGSLFVAMVLHATIDLTSGRLMAAAVAAAPDA